MRDSLSLSGGASWFADASIIERDRFGGVEALPFIQYHGPNVTFMHDNARPHSAAITRQFLATNNVTVLVWPANSPDLNPIDGWQVGCIGF